LHISNLGHQAGRDTAANILKQNGIEPAPERGVQRRRWKAVLSVLPGMFAADFLEGHAHEFIKAGGNLMPPDRMPESLGNTGEIGMYEAVPERNQWIRQVTMSISLLKMREAGS
jgi:hypothetical protein